MSESVSECQAVPSEPESLTQPGQRVSEVVTECLREGVNKGVTISPCGTDGTCHSQADPWVRTGRCGSDRFRSIASWRPANDGVAVSNASMTSGISSALLPTSALICATFSRQRAGNSILSSRKRRMGAVVDQALGVNTVSHTHQRANHLVVQVG